MIILAIKAFQHSICAVGGSAAAAVSLGDSSSKPRSGKEGPIAKKAKDRGIQWGRGGVLVAVGTFWVCCGISDNHKDYY